MKLFNSFQLVLAFVAWPFGIQWISDASFRGAGAAFYAACAGYIIAFGFMVAAVYNGLDELESPRRI